MGDANAEARHFSLDSANLTLQRHCVYRNPPELGVCGGLLHLGCHTDSIDHVVNCRDLCLQLVFYRAYLHGQSGGLGRGTLRNLADCLAQALCLGHLRPRCRAA